jgi:hypothetical protein
MLLLQGKQPTNLDGKKRIKTAYADLRENSLVHNIQTQISKSSIEVSEVKQ